MVMPDGALGGFCTLSSTAPRLQQLPEDTARRRLPRYPLVPATLIGRLAIDRRYHGQGWGSFLLLDALHRCTTDIASFAVVVDAIDDETRTFYLRASFLSLPDSPHRLFRRISDIKQLFCYLNLTPGGTFRDVRGSNRLPGFEPGTAISGRWVGCAGRPMTISVGARSYDR
jgi:hypothetical protein